MRWGHFFISKNIFWLLLPKCCTKMLPASVHWITREAGTEKGKAWSALSTAFLASRIRPLTLGQMACKLPFLGEWGNKQARNVDSPFVCGENAIKGWLCTFWGKYICSVAHSSGNHMPRRQNDVYSHLHVWKLQLDVGPKTFVHVSAIALLRKNASLTPHLS